VTISEVDISTLKIGGISMPPERFIQLLRKELRAAKCGIPGLDAQRIKALAAIMPSGDHIENTPHGNAKFDEFAHEREAANLAGSTFKLWPEEGPEDWKGNFLELLDRDGRCVYKIYWDSGGPVPEPQNRSWKL
jgi:hypothetical protein